MIHSVRGLGDGSIITLTTAGLPASKGAFEGGQKLLAGFDELAMCSYSLGDHVEARGQHRGGDDLAEELVLLVVVDAPDTVISDNEHDGQIVPQGGVDLESVEAESAVSP